MTTNNPLSRKITFLNVFTFTIPTIIMTMFISFYTMVDGIFVARFVNTSALSAVNIVFPFINIVIGLGIMLATGGSAFVSKQMGEGKTREARQSFSMLIYLSIGIGFIIMLIGFCFTKSILNFLGSNEAVFDYCKSYFTMLLWSIPFGMLQMQFQYFFVTAGKPTIGLIAVILGGIANIVLDYVFIVPLNMGIMGAALATGIGLAFPAISGLLYFSLYRKGPLFLVAAKINAKQVFQCCANGSSEMVGNLSVALTTFLFNIMMMRYLGENGVAAITIVLYAEYLLNAVFSGYSSGVSPLFGYNYGNGNKDGLKKLFQISKRFVASVSLLVFLGAMLFSNRIVSVFALAGSDVYHIANNGLHLFSFGFLFMGTNLFVSALFTALSNGKASAILSFLRTFLLITGAILLLPRILGVNGIWLAVPVAEAFAIVISLVFVCKYRKRYQY